MPVTMQNRGSFSVLIKNVKNTKKEGQKGFSLVFLNPSSPRPASSSLGPPNNFMMKKPTRLGELIASKLSFNSPGRAAFAPSAHFPINRRAREAEGRFQGSEGEGIERREKEEEKTRLRRYRIATAIIPYIVPCSMFFVRPSVSFVFKI